MTLTLATITFPEIRLPQRAAAQLRGFFGTYFRDHSPLLHNHFEDGSTRYAYPLVQYKVLRGVPTLVGIEEGGRLLASLFFEIKQLHIQGQDYPVLERNIQAFQVPIGCDTRMHAYGFMAPWMALNSENFAQYREADPAARHELLTRILVGNLLSFYKGVGLHLGPEERLFAVPRVQPMTTRFKNQDMLAFKGEFLTNALLPDFVGLGKSVARGYGTVRRKALSA